MGTFFGKIAWMSPRLRPTTHSLDLEALLLRSAAFPSGDAFELYIQSLPRPKKQRARPRSRSRAKAVLSPDTSSPFPLRAIHTPEDLRALIETLQLGDYSDNPLQRYLCPWHDFEPATVTLIPQAGRSTLLHCHQCGYLLTPVDLLVRMFGATKAVIFARNIWSQRLLDGDFIDVEVVRID